MCVAWDLLELFAFSAQVSGKPKTALETKTVN